WGAGLVILFQIVTAVIFPLFIAPLFNHYSPLPDSPLKAQILSLARANDIPADNVWLVDASRQSSRISANVSGFLGTTRISLNDNLLHQGTPDEVLAVLGHEMGHYVMGHMTRLILLGGLVTIFAFAFMHWGFMFATEFFGGQWQVRRVEDIAGLPLLVALASIFYFLATPVTNTITRTTEHQADIFGLDAVRKPDAFATAMLKLSTYRKLEPGKWEEIIFYDHPSGRTRIMDAMIWKKEHIRDVDIRDTVSPQ
ncbi:MAG TPA: M48 family metalloprotease, partial [Rhizomicrobium sp.]